MSQKEYYKGMTEELLETHGPEEADLREARLGRTAIGEPDLKAAALVWGRL